MARAAEALSAEEQGTRRRLLSFLGWGSFVSFCGGVTVGSLRFLFPRILYEPSQQFIAGKPGGLSGRGSQHPNEERAARLDDS